MTGPPHERGAASWRDDEVLARCPMFAPLEPEDLAALAAIARPHRFEAGQMVFFAGERPAGLHVVVAGRIKIFVLAPGSGREFVLTIEHPYQAVAELPSLDEDVYPASAQAVERTETLFLEQEAFTRVLRERPGVSLHLVRTLGRRLRRLVALLEQISFHEVIHRLAGHLLDRAHGEGVPFVLETNGVIAAQIGTVPELVSRTLSRLHQSEFVRLSDRTIVGIDQERLRELAKGPHD